MRNTEPEGNGLLRRRVVPWNGSAAAKARELVQAGMRRWRAAAGAHVAVQLPPHAQMNAAVVWMPALGALMSMCCGYGRLAHRLSVTQDAILYTHTYI